MSCYGLRNRWLSMVRYTDQNVVCWKWNCFLGDALLIDNSVKFVLCLWYTSGKYLSVNIGMWNCTFIEHHGIAHLSDIHTIPLQKCWSLCCWQGTPKFFKRADGSQQTTEVHLCAAQLKYDCQFHRKFVVLWLWWIDKSMKKECIKVHEICC